MDFGLNTVLKEHHTFFVGDAAGRVTNGEHGLYNRDTRFLSRYRWSWLSGGKELASLTVESPRTDTLYSHHSLIEGPSQVVAVRRHLRLHAAGLDDELEVENSSAKPQLVTLRLEVEGDFADLFEVRGWKRLERETPQPAFVGDQLALGLTASDGVRMAAKLAFSEPAQTDGNTLEWRVALDPKQTRALRVEIRLDNPLDDPPTGAVDYDTWRARFAGVVAAAAGPCPTAGAESVLAKAIDDLRGLLLFTPDGPISAAGIPWFVAAFGRDALITAHLLLPYAPEVAEGTLRHFARYQGRKDDPFRAENPGKIMHELRYGELTRIGRSPHSPYYGTVDATPLYLMLLEAHRNATGSLALVKELRPAWEAALAWLDRDGDPDGDGFIEFTPDLGAGLAVQSWKDSHDSMSHADGSLAEGSLAVSEVQGYTFAAYRAAAAWYGELGEPGSAAAYERRAAELAAAFHAAFWLEPAGTYALALDGAKRPLQVLASDAGQLLWTGIVPEAAAGRLVKTLMSPPLWSGWGIRTLGSGEVRYNPVSYHNGSVWPHDSALIAAGMAAYGFAAEARTVARALYELAVAQPDGRLPELVGGYQRDERPPVPYPVACRPQAWDAAALVHLLRYL